MLNLSLEILISLFFFSLKVIQKPTLPGMRTKLPQPQYQWTEKFNLLDRLYIYLISAARKMNLIKYYLKKNIYKRKKTYVSNWLYFFITACLAWSLVQKYRSYKRFVPEHGIYHFPKSWREKLARRVAKVMESLGRILWVF